MMDAEERELFATSLRQATSSTSGDDLDVLLAELGWADALALDERAAVATLFGLQGEAGSTSSALGLVVLAALGADRPDGAGVVLPPFGRTSAPGSTDGTCMPVHGLGLGDLRRRSEAVVVAIGDDGKVVSTVVATDALGARPVVGLDPALDLVAIDLECVTASRPWALLPGSWADAVAAGQRAVAHEMVGAMRTMLALACDHARERIQFGVPIGSFQAVRHRLAETLVAVEAADAALDAAWVDRGPVTAALAKAVAGHSARTTRRHCQQVLAGIGFTTEHDLHRYVRRTLVLDGLFGDARTLTEQIGAGLLATRRLPAITPL